MCQHRTLTISNTLFFEQLLLWLKDHKEVEFILKGNSMCPFLREGDKVTLGNFDLASLDIGHIVLVQSGDKYILHRIIKIAREKVLLAGDANIVQTETVDKQDVLALVLEAYRDNNRIPVYSTVTLVAARFWYYMRPFRRIVAVLSRSFKKKIK